MNDVVANVKVVREMTGKRPGRILFLEGLNEELRVRWDAENCREVRTPLAGVGERRDCLNIVRRAGHDLRCRAHQRTHWERQFDAARVNGRDGMRGFIGAHLLDDRA